MLNFEAINQENKNLEKLLKLYNDDIEKKCIILQTYAKKLDGLSIFIKNQVNMIVENLENKWYNEIENENIKKKK